MRSVFSIALVAACSFAPVCFGQSAANIGHQTLSLCSLQKEVAEGEQKSVWVSGVFSEGLDRGTLQDNQCPKEVTWVELQLRSQQNKDKLHKLLERRRRAYVVFEGDFYGPPMPDPKVPEAIRKQYHPGWGHLAAFKTKLVVHEIRSVETAPPVRDRDSSVMHESRHAAVAKP